jgi:uncharacterized membrane protein YhhN
MSAVRRIVPLRLSSVRAMRRNSTLILSLVFLLAAVFSVTGNLSARPWLRGLFTPLATTCILALAFSNWLGFKKNYALWISIGLFFSRLGEIALLRPAHYVLPGLIAFLFTHIAYLVAFTRDTKFFARLSILFLYLCMAAALYLFLFPGLAGVLKLPTLSMPFCSHQPVPCAVARALLLIPVPYG